MIITRKNHHILALRLLHNITKLKIADMCAIDCDAKMKFMLLQYMQLK